MDNGYDIRNFVWEAGVRRLNHHWAIQSGMGDGKNALQTLGGREWTRDSDAEPRMWEDPLWTTPPLGSKRKLRDNEVLVEWAPGDKTVYTMLFSVHNTEEFASCGKLVLGPADHPIICGRLAGASAGPYTTASFTRPLGAWMLREEHDVFPANINEYDREIYRCLFNGMFGALSWEDNSPLGIQLLERDLARTFGHRIPQNERPNFVNGFARWKAENHLKAARGER